MIRLWSRAAQAQHVCNCSTCLTATSRIAPRATRASLRRHVGRPDVLTALSSTLIFSAAVADGMSKDKKLQGWDKAIEDTRAEIEALEQEHRERLGKLKTTARNKTNVSWEDLTSKDSWLSQTTWAELLEWAEEKEKERASNGFQDWRGIPLSMLKNLAEGDLMKILLDKRILSRFYGGSDCSSIESAPQTHVYSPKKLRTLEWSILKLVLRLLKSSVPRARIQGSSERAAEAVNGLLPATFTSSQHRIEDIQNVDRRLQMLQAEPKESSLYRHFPSPSLPRYHFSPSEREEDLASLNEELDSLLLSNELVDMASISSVCKLLLTSRIAPNVHTYNLLLVRFSQLRSEPLVMAVLDSLRESHVRPNEITHATLLRFFGLTKNTSEFCLYIQKMNGFKQGLSLAATDRAIEPLTYSRYRTFGKCNQKIAELARLNGEVYTCVIKGLLEMCQFSEAAWYYMNMVTEGWKPTMELLTALLKHCCQTTDLVSGWQVWKTMLEQCRMDVHISREAYESMLSLCKLCGSLKLYDWVLQNGVHKGTLTLGASIAQSCTQDLSSRLENHALAIVNAVNHTITVQSMQTRYPYIPTSMIRERLRVAASGAERAQHSLQDRAYSSRSFYTMTTRALLMDSFDDAQEYIGKATAMTEHSRQVILSEARWVFQLHDELSGLNHIHASSTQAVTSERSRSLEAAQYDDHELSTVSESSVQDSPSEGVRSDLLTQIETLESQMAPKLVINAYNDFRRRARKQERTLENKVTVRTKYDIPPYMQTNDLNRTWIGLPTFQLEAEAG